MTCMACTADDDFNSECFCLPSADAQAYWNASVTLDYPSLDHDSQCE